MEVDRMDFYILAAFPLLYYDEETINSFVNYAMINLNNFFN